MRSDVLSVLIGVKIVWKGYQQMIKVAASKERVEYDFFLLSIFQDTQEFVIKTLLLLHQSSSPLVPYGNPECRRLLYRVLLACALTPHPSAPPPLHCAVSCLSAGLQDQDFEVRIEFTQASR